MDVSVIVLGVIVLATFVLHAHTLRSHATERERLVQLAVARDGREYAQIRRASGETPAPVESAPVPDVQIGMGG
jgi:Tfp pilus assembly protein PilV